ncbi:hypothetical protein [Roseiconus lacunae]|uniref:Uncharacterized protein n=1 Tax=Roseiconus lacunae TaxID=2605694 RepID=A0ABT7PHY9_9BACT|nr:hypothetical protein [Roseiconus lacunae]MDM4016119.1 hypothetical protein [Roseiconus lacunae]
MRRELCTGALALATMVAGGCSSSRSTMLARNECNTGWNKIGHLHGTPITLRVPTHLRVYVYQTHYLEQVSVGTIKRWQKVELPPVYDFGSETLYTDKIFTTDFIRPAAGAFNLDVDYTDDQYIQKVQQDITDETLEEIANLVAQIPALFTPTTAVQVEGEDAESGLKEVKSVLAAGVFEIDDPNFETNVAGFVDRYLNCRGPHCNDSAPCHEEFTVIPGTDVGAQAFTDAMPEAESPQ